MNWFLAKRQKIIKISFLILLLIIINGGVFLLFKSSLKSPSEPSPKITTSSAQISKENKSDSAKSGAKQGFSDALADCKSNSKPEFSADITLLSKISYLTPPVTVQGDDLKTHGYIHLAHDKSEKVPVYAPAEARAYEGAYYDVNSGPLYVLFFEVSCEVRFMIDHIAEPVEKIIKELPEAPADSSQGIKFGPVKFETGELIGYVGFTEGSKNWDFGVYNSEYKNPYRDKKYESSDSFRYLNAICPYEYFSKESKANYKKLFTDSYGKEINSGTNLCADL